MTGSLRKDYIWNTIGTAIYAFFSMALVFAALRAAGPDEGGVFSFGFSTLGQQMFIVAYFGVRPFHITDTRREFSYGGYRSLRRWTSAAAVFTAICYAALMALAGEYGPRKALLVVLLAGYKICDGYADLYESECQRCGRLYIGGMELAVRSLVSGGCMAAVLFITGDAVYAALWALLLQFACILWTGAHIEGLAGISAYGGVFPEGRKGFPIKLFTGTFTVFLSVFLDFYIFSASRYAIDLFLTDSDSGVFNVIFLPTSVIYITANFIIRPYMNKLSAFCDENDGESFSAALKRLMLAIAGMAAAGLLAAALLGKAALFIIELILGSEYEGLLYIRHFELVSVIMGGCFYAAANLFYYVLIILRRQKLIFIIYAAMAAAVFVLSGWAVVNYGIRGAAVSYAFYMGALAAAFAVSCAICMKKAFGKAGTESQGADWSGS